MPFLGEHELQTFAFRFAGDPEHVPCQLVSVGWQKPTVNYHWSGLSRVRMEQTSYSFQYTLSGRGVLETGGQVYSLEQGQAFFIETPSPYDYYLPEDSSHWEFLYIQAVGEEAKRAYRLMKEKSGPTLFLPADSGPVHGLWEVWEKAKGNRVQNGYIGAKLTFGFLMELQAYLQSPLAFKSLPVPIRVALSFLDKHYAEAIGIDDLARAAGLSKFYFAHYFKRVIGMPPLQYLTKLRIEKAAELLSTTPLLVGDIGKLVGYPNSNYFCRIFKAMTGSSPQQFRSDPVDRLHLF